MSWGALALHRLRRVWEASEIVRNSSGRKARGTAPQAEMHGLIGAFRMAAMLQTMRDRTFNWVSIRGDNGMAIQFMKGSLPSRSPEMKKLHAEASQALDAVRLPCVFQQIPREENRLAHNLIAK